MLNAERCFKPLVWESFDKPVQESVANLVEE